MSLTHADSTDSLNLASAVDALCDRYEAALVHGTAGSLDNWLPQSGPVRAGALIELVRLEFEHRLRLGETAQPDDYFARYPELAADANMVQQLLAIERRCKQDPAGQLAPTVRAPVKKLGLQRTPAGQLPQIPGFEIEKELGRGGMGIVYKARHCGLNRIVALKMIRSGIYADGEERDRFRAEAEAIARLRHPNIVQIHEVSEHERLPYFVLEFVEGGDLDGRLDGSPLPAGEAAALVEVLAKAIHHAHERNLVHRDLKPANVLLRKKSATENTQADKPQPKSDTERDPVSDLGLRMSDFEPMVTDFGLAKRLDVSGQTESTALLGTPCYMAPEQASRKNKQIGPAADVYALGAILYECLTSRPPFKAATSLETIQQVLSDEPVSPRQLQSGTPRDLETICLKCLEKDAKKRYASAAALADDLRRFQAGEPILARPVGQVERASKWVRRRPAIASLMALVLFTFILGTIVSLGFAILANDRAVQAETNLHDKEKEHTKLVAALNKERVSRAVGMFRPIGPNRVGDNAPLDVNVNELNTLWDVACLEEEDESVRLLFIDRALDRPETALQLERRSAMAVHAAVGLNRGRQEKLLDLMRLRLRDPRANFSIRAASAVVVAELRPAPSAVADEALLTLLETLEQPSERGSAIDLSEHLRALAGKLSPATAAAAIDKILEAMNRNSDDRALTVLTASLVAIALRLDEKGADAAAAKMVDAMTKTPVLYTLRGMSNGLAVIAPRLSDKASVAAAQKILDAMGKPLDEFRPNNDIRVKMFSAALVVVAPRLDEKSATAAAVVILGEMNKTKDSFTVQSLAAPLTVLAGRLDEETIATASRQIMERMAKATDERGLAMQAPVLKAIAPRLGETVLAEAAQKILERMNKTSSAVQLRGLGLLLETIQAPAHETAARETAAAVAVKIVGDMAKTSDPMKLQPLADALAAVLPWLEAKAAGATTKMAVDRVLEVLAKVTNEFIYGELAVVVVPLASWLDQKAAAAVMQKILAGTSATPPPFVLVTVSSVLGALAPQMDKTAVQTSAAAIARKFSDTMAKITKMSDFGNLNPAFQILVPLLDEETAHDLAVVAARRLTDWLARSKDDGNFIVLGADLAVFAPWLDEKAASALLPKVEEALAIASQTQAFESLALALAKLTPRLNEKEFARAARHLLNAMARASNSKLLWDKSELPDDLLFPKAAGKLSAQDLVDLLKHPVCVGLVRAGVLRRLGEIYNHSFNDVWELVDWLAEHAPEVDSRSVPVRTLP